MKGNKKKRVFTKGELKNTIISNDCSTKLNLYLDAIKSTGGTIKHSLCFLQQSWEVSFIDTFTFGNDFQVDFSHSHSMLSSGKYKELTLDDFYEKESGMFKYELVKDLTLNEIAKAMIDGEVFYSEKGNVEFFWSGTCFCGTHATYLAVSGEYYRKVKCEWYDKLDGTVSKGILCWVSNTNPDLEEYIELVTAKEGVWQSFNVTWEYATPLTKEEIKAFMDNTPE